MLKIISSFVAASLLALSKPAVAEQNYFLTAFILGYLNNLGVTSSVNAPSTCGEWYELPQGALVTTFDLAVESNIPFSTTLQYPAVRDVTDVCRPAIEFTAQQVAIRFPVALDILINNELMGTIEDGFKASSSSLSSKFEVYNDQCITQDDDLISRPVIEQTAQETFKGQLSILMKNAFDPAICDLDEEYTLCQCAEGEALHDALVGLSTPMLTSLISPSDYGNAIADSLLTGSQLKLQCEALAAELAEAEIEPTMQLVPEECWSQTPFKDDSRFDPDNATRSTVNAAN